MTKDERQILLTMCESLNELLEMQTLMYRSLKALSLGLEIQLPNLKAVCKETDVDALFLDGATMRLSAIRQRMTETTQHLNSLPPDSSA